MGRAFQLWTGIDERHAKSWSSKDKLVEAIIRENPRISFTMLEVETGITRFTLHKIIHERLGMRKIRSSWVPHDLNESQKDRRVQYCKKNRALFNEAKWRLCDVLPVMSRGFTIKRLLSKHLIQAG
jgi:hypothetical protein